MAFFPHHPHFHNQQPPQPQPPQQQQQSIPFRNFVPISGQISAPIPFFSNSAATAAASAAASAAAFPDPSPQLSLANVLGLAPGSVPSVADGGESNGWEPRRKRLKEQDLLENSQISSIDFFQTGSVSTGLGLSLDNRRVATAAPTEASPLLLLPMIDKDIDREVQRIDAEMDQFIKAEGERLRQSILEKVQASQFQTLASVEEKILRKIRDKEAQVNDINRKNIELEEQMKQLALEVGTWQQRAKYNENLINSLKYNLEQLYARSLRIHKEGCGDSEVDDTASCCNGNVNLQLMGKQNKELKSSMACKICRINEVCMLLLPCRHLCLCKDCESKLSFCPLCQSSKLIGMEVYM